MRITQNLSYDAYVNDLTRRQEAIYRLNRQMATGHKVNSASDDPAAAHNILTSKSILSSIDQYDRNVDYGLSSLSFTETALDSAKDAIMRLQELAVTAASGLSSQEARSHMLSEVNNLRETLISIGNSNFEGRYIFAGYKTDTEAFDSTGTFQGDANTQQLKINSSGSVAIGVNGGDVFRGASGGVDILQVVADFSTALASNDRDGVLSSVTGLENSFNQVSSVVSDIGGRISRLNAAKEDFSDYRLEVSSKISELEDADITALISDLKTNQVALEAALASAGKVFSINIFDYL
ncbi:MAG: flagellar hook-associated protein FlgL [Deltaproteobacteria bacterium]|nr:flagellar hook-associated protein FlgL [Deltaproteobacteria bacterium]